ncbi:helix-turn-helix domain-containing protein, partial [Halorubrum sp. SS7]
LETDRNTNVDVIPNVGPTLRRLRESLGLTQYECGVPRSTYRHYEAGNRNPSRDALRRIVDAFEDACGSPIDSDTDAFAKTDGGSTARDVAALGQLAESDIRWDQIESIERVEPDDEWVYDLEVEGTHNYVSNGIVSHNSQMISYVEN